MDEAVAGAAVEHRGREVRLRCRGAGHASEHDHEGEQRTGPGQQRAPGNPPPGGRGCGSRGHRRRPVHPATILIGHSSAAILDGMDEPADRAAAHGRTYLDVASAAPWHPSALATYARVAAELPADPMRRHRAGRAARDLLESARGAVATSLGAASDRVLFTSGGTESIHLAIIGGAMANRTRPRRIVSTAVEHSAVLAASAAAAAAHDHEHVVVPVDADGQRGSRCARGRAAHPGRRCATCSTRTMR
jgi:hypothetical protein